MQSIAIFVDVQNVYYTTRQAFQRHFDYNAFWAQVTHGRKVVKAIAYAVDKGDQKQQAFQNILRAIGFEVKLKPFIQRADGTAKGDWDVGITIDMLDHATQADVAVLLSGDGDFAILIDKLTTHHHIEVEVYGVPSLTAVALINAATQFVPIDHHLLL